VISGGIKFRGRDRSFGTFYACSFLFFGLRTSKPPSRDITLPLTHTHTHAHEYTQTHSPTHAHKRTYTYYQREVRQRFPRVALQSIRARGRMVVTLLCHCCYTVALQSMRARVRTVATRCQIKHHYNNRARCTPGKHGCTVLRCLF
jgi:hypothetical protein